MIELLVVVAIIVVLIAMLLPALTSARGAARNITCQNSVRQIGSAIYMYAEDNGNYMPIATDSFGYVSQSPNKRIWIDDLCSYDVTPGSGVFKCPSDENPLQMSDDVGAGWVGLYDQPGHDGYVSYAYNLHYGYSFWDGHDFSYYPQRLDALQYPRKALFVVDGDTSAFPADLFVFDAGGYGVTWRHGAGTFNSLFGDLSVQNLNWPRSYLGAEAGPGMGYVRYADYLYDNRVDYR